MSRVSFGEVWDQTRAFAVKEFSLLAPVALACFAVPAITWAMVMPENLDPAKPPPPGLWTVWLIPMSILLLVGSLTLSALALTPGMSVKEAFRRAVGRLGVAIGILLVALGILLLLALASLIVGGTPILVGMSKEGISNLAATLLLAILLAASTRLTMLWPIVVDGKEGPVQALRRALQLSVGAFWRLFGLMLLALAVSVVLATTVELAGGSVMLLLGRAIGNDALGRVLGEALSAIVLSLWQMVIVIYVAFLYRAYAGSEKTSRGSGSSA